MPTSAYPKLQFTDKFFRIRQGVCNRILKLKMHHRGNLVTTVPRMRRWCGRVRAPPPPSSTGIPLRGSESARRDEHKFDLRGNGGRETIGGDTSTRKNTFLGNKLPENLIFPLVELCLHQWCFLQNGKNPTRREDGQTQQSQTCHPPN